MTRPPFDEYFHQTDAGHFIATAAMYIRSARIVRDSDQWSYQSSMLARPTLHLLSHAVELLLKFPLIYAGKTPDQVKSYGHRLSDLWQQNDNRFVKKALAANARKQWNYAQQWEVAKR